MLTPCAALVQRYDPERFLTTLFAPAASREPLSVLYAFNHELARARMVASAPMLALIRLQWWRDVVEGADRRHEVATPLGALIADGTLDRRALLRMIEGREMEADEAISSADLPEYLAATAGALMVEAGRVLGSDQRQALERQGSGCGAVGLIRNAAAHRAHGRWTWPDDMQQADVATLAWQLLGAGRVWPASVLPAALPGTLARRALKHQGRSRPGHDRLGHDKLGPDRLGPAGQLAVWAASISHWC